MKALIPFFTAALVFAACGAPPPVDHSHETCECTVAPAAGTVTLAARSSFEDADAGYLAAVFSFEKASTDVAVTNNDWDLLFGNDQDPADDLFTVATVTDDQSYIVDLGAIELREVPETVEPDADVDQAYGVRVVEGHVYYVRTLDGDSEQVAVFGVKKHTLNQSVEIAWFRSSEKNRFVFEWP